jgi:hypothetical protein
MSIGNTVPIDINKSKNISSPFRWRKCFFLLSVFSTILLHACKEPDAVGLDVLPAVDGLSLVFSDTATLFSKTVLEDSLRTDEISLQLLGSISDPVFGKHEAAIFAQVALEGVPTFGTITQADSLVLSILYNNAYGDTTYPQTINVYRMTEDMYFDSAYYSNRSFSYDPTPLGTASIAPRPLTPVVVGSDTVSPRLLIKLSTTLADSIMALNGQSQLSTNALWVEYFKGLHIVTDPVSGASTGNLSYLNFVGSKMILYYHDTTNTAKSYSFSLASTRMTRFRHDYTGTDVGQQLADSTALDSISYIQSLAGVKTKITLPYLKHFLDSGSIVLNKAELELSIEPNTFTDYPTPPRLFFLAIKEDGGSEFPLDYFEIAGYHGGTLISETNKYKFNIARHLQRILDGRLENFGFYLVPSGSSIQGNRVILGSPLKNIPTEKMKLNLYYTKLPR